MPARNLSVEQLEFAASMLKSMAHPKRIVILRELEKHKELTVTEIYKKIKLEQSSTSHHLAILRRHGVLFSVKRGKQVYYSIKHESLNQIVDCVSKCTIENENDEN